MLIGDVWITRQAVTDIAARLGVHRTTVQRWIDSGELPPAVHKLMRILQHGDLGEIHDAWCGWSIDARRGDLVTPVGDLVQPGQVMAYPYNAHLVSALQSEKRDLEAWVQQLKRDIYRLEKQSQAAANTAFETGRYRHESDVLKQTTTITGA